MTAIRKGIDEIIQRLDETHDSTNISKAEEKPSINYADPDIRAVYFDPYTHNYIFTEPFINCMKAAVSVVDCRKIQALIEAIGFKVPVENTNALNYTTNKMLSIIERERENIKSRKQEEERRKFFGIKSKEKEESLS